jgi:hypothetical protein
MAPTPMTLAADALSALRAATSECAGAAGCFSPEQCAAGVALANKLRALFSRPVAAAATADVGEVQTLLLPHLPTELLLQVVRHLEVRDLARLAVTCQKLYFGPPCPPRPTSVVEEELRRRAADAGRRLPSSPPASVSGWVPALLQREWRHSLEVGTVAAGISPHSLFVGAKGALMVCGYEDEVGTLGLPSSQGEVLVPIPVPCMAGIRMRHVVAGYDCSLAVSEAGRVYMWGAAQYGRLASDKEDRLVPTLIQELSHHPVRQVAIDQNTCAAVTEEGLLFTWVTAASTESYSVEEALQRGPILGLGLDGTIIHDCWPPQCVTALKEERVGCLGGGWVWVHTGDHGGWGRLLFWKWRAGKPRSR